MFDQIPQSLTLGQQDATPAAPSGQEGVAAQEGQDGSPAPGGGPGPGPQQTQSPFGGLGFMVMILLMFVLIFVFSSRGQKKERQKQEQMLSSLSKGDRVRTIGGVIGSVIEVRDQDVVLKVDESTNTRMRFARSAIASRVDAEQS